MMIQHCVYCHVTSFEGGRVWTPGLPKVVQTDLRVVLGRCSFYCWGGRGCGVSRRVMRTAALPRSLTMVHFRRL